MNDKIINRMAENILLKVKNDIDKYPYSRTYDFSYWKGYCNGIEDANNMDRNIIWNYVNNQATIYCQKHNID